MTTSQEQRAQLAAACVAIINARTNDGANPVRWEKFTDWGDWFAVELHARGVRIYSPPNVASGPGPT